MEEIGLILKKRREEKNLTLEQVENETKIKKNYLIALENGNFSVLPGEVYTKAFIRTYSKFLGLNTDELMIFFKKEGPDMSEENNVSEQPISTKPNRNKPIYKKSIGREKDFSNAKTKNHWYLIVASVGLIALFFTFSSILDNRNNNDDIANQVPKVSENQPGDNIDNNNTNNNTNNNNNKNINIDNSSENNPDNPEDSIQKENNDVQLLLNIKKGNSWVRITADGQVVYEGTAAPGQKLEYSAKNKLLIRVGNAGAVEAVVNGQNIGILGKTGQIVDKEFVAENNS